ncbi:MAG TPA: SCO family protein, partial [Marmoricola sp.]|nr:SCO family protein [Marmoricola sp.]
AHARSRAVRVIGVGAAIALLTACGSSANPHAGHNMGAQPGASSSPTSQPPSISGGTELDAVLSPQIANMAFQDQSGKTVHLADFKGKSIVIQDSMTLCQEQCPIDTATFVAMARQYGSTAKNPADTVFLTITVDPERDTPAQLAAYRNLYAPGANELPGWQLLTGSVSDITALWKYFHVYWEKVHSHEDVKNWRTGEKLTYDVLHGDEVFFIDKALQQRYLLDGMPSLGGAIPSKIEHFMSAEGMQNMKKQNWTVADGIKAVTWVNSL